jgi:integrase
MSKPQKRDAAKPAKSELWQKSSYANLIRYVPSGVFFCRIRVRGILIRKSLKTDVLSVARLRLADEEKKHRQAADRNAALQRGSKRMSFGDALALYRERLKNNAEIKRRTRDYYEQRIDALLKSWPGLNGRNVQDITVQDCETWAGKFKGSATAFNNTLLVLRFVLDICMEQGVLYENAALRVNRRTVKPKELQLPDNDQFATLVETVEKAGGRFSKDCGDLLRFLSFGGFRLGEARHIAWKDCDFKREEIIVRGDPEEGTKNSQIRRVPMIGEMRQLLERIKGTAGEPDPEARVMRVQECQQALNTATAKLNLPHLTHHDLRHLFATRCIESGVDIPTVSRWLGHKDGGALAMKVYGHLRNQHSKAMAQKVSFGVTQPPQPPPPNAGPKQASQPANLPKSVAQK